MIQRSNVFISSTSRDLEAYRNVVTKTILKLGLHPIIMEAFNTTDANALQLCYDKVQEADIFIGIYAHRYGYVPSPEVTLRTVSGEIRTGDGQTSITHFEYLWALERGLPALIFVIGDKDTEGKSLSLVSEYIEEEPGETRLKNFKKNIMSRHVVGFFHSVDNLAVQVATALIDVMLSTTKILSVPTQDGIKISGSKVNDVSFYFKDRDQYRDEIKRLILQPSTRLISVIGRGGIGKTALVSKVLHEIEKHSSIGDKFRSLQGIVYLSTRTKGITLERIFMECAALFDDEASQSVLLQIWTSPKLTNTQKIEQFLVKLSSDRYVILLDNMEDLLDEYGHIVAEDLREFFTLTLKTTHNICLLVTSREPLELPKELMRFDNRVIISDGLPINEAVEVLQDLDPYGAYGLRDADQVIVHQLVQKVHGVPRALEIIASLLANDPLLSLHELCQKNEIFIREEFVENLVRENYKRLDTEAQLVVKALAIYGIPVNLDALEFLLQPFVLQKSVRETLNQLIQRHVVSFNRNTKVFWLHPLDQDYIYYQIPE
jgi:hypothetical protein